MLRSLLVLALCFATVTSAGGNAFCIARFGRGNLFTKHRNAEEPATISLKSKPISVAIYADGEFAGTTPATLKVRAGNHTIRLTREGYKDWSQELIVEAGSDVQITVSLVK